MSPAEAHLHLALALLCPTFSPRSQTEGSPGNGAHSASQCCSSILALDSCSPDPLQLILVHAERKRCACFITGYAAGMRGDDPGRLVAERTAACIEC